MEGVLGFTDLALLAVLLAVIWLFWRVMITWTKVDLDMPDFVIHGGGVTAAQQVAYLKRWYVIPRNRVCNIYLHQILRDDDDRALHDHPWPNCSIVLRGGYREVMPGRDGGLRGVDRRAGSVVFRRPTSAHRLIVGDGFAWTLFLTGPKVRDWGFWCPKGWVPWWRFVDPGNTGAIGRGCAQDQAGGGIVTLFLGESARAVVPRPVFPGAEEFHGDAG